MCLSCSRLEAWPATRGQIVDPRETEVGQLVAGSKPKTQLEVRQVESVIIELGSVDLNLSEMTNSLGKCRDNLHY